MECVRIWTVAAMPAVKSVGAATNSSYELIENCTIKNNRGRDSSVGIATRYGLDGPGIGSRWGARFSAPFQTGCEVHPVSYTMGTGSFPGVKRPGRGVDHLAPRLKEEYSYTSTPPLSLRGLF